MLLIRSLVALAIVANSGGPRASAAELPAKVKVDLEQNAASLDPITVEWSYERTRGDAVEDRRRESFSWQAGKARYLVASRMAKAPAAPAESAFDGNVYYSSAAGGNTLGRDRLTPSDDLVFQATYFIQNGVRPPLTGRQLLRGTCVSAPLERLAAGDNLVAVEPIGRDGLDLLALRLSILNQWRSDSERTDMGELEAALRTWVTDPNELKARLDGIRQARDMPERLILSFYLDPARRHVVVGWDERYADGTLLRQCKLSDFVQVADRGSFLPQQARLDWHVTQTKGLRLSATPIWSETARVERIDPAPLDDGVFVLQRTRPGTKVFDHVSAGQPAVRELSAPADVTSGIASRISDRVAALTPRASPAPVAAAERIPVASRRVPMLALGGVTLAVIVVVSGIVLTRRQPRPPQRPVG